MTGWIQRTLRECQYRFIREADFKVCVDQLKGCYDSLERQLIHRDMHFGNILFDHGEFSGYVDFDLSQKNVRIFDICYFLVGLLVKREKNHEDVQKWYNIVSDFIEGYETINSLTGLEKDSINCLMGSIEVLFTAYFISIGDDASARSAANLYYFVQTNERRIRQAVYHQMPII